MTGDPIEFGEDASANNLQTWPPPHADAQPLRTIALLPLPGRDETVGSCSLEFVVKLYLSKTIVFILILDSLPRP